MRKSVVTKNKERDMTDELDQSTKDEWAGSVHNAIAYHDVADVPDPKGAPYVGLKERNLLRKVGGIRFTHSIATKWRKHPARRSGNVNSLWHQ